VILEKAYRHLRYRRLSVAIDKLPQAFEGFCIAHLSDVHITSKTPLEALARLVDSLNEQTIDMIALTGDLFDTPPSKIASQLALLKQIRHPVYFVSGNHDLVYAKDVLEPCLQELGFIFLDNRIAHVSKGDACLQLVGLSDAFSRYFGIRRNERALFEQLDRKLPALLLAHQPKDIRFTKHVPIALQLSGHTHGGQIYPFHYLVRLFQPYLQGLHRIDHRQLYVTRGYGSWGIKMRFLAPSEVAIITLKKDTHATH
jgi:hypothetical protein